MKSWLALIVGTLALMACATPTYLDETVLAHWNSIKTEANLLGKWEGTAPDGSYINYNFMPYGNCEWGVGRKTLKCKYIRYQSHNDNLNVLIHQFEDSGFKDVEFLATIKIQGSQMMVYGVPAKHGLTQEGDKASWSETFLEDSILLNKINAQNNE